MSIARLSSSRLSSSTCSLGLADAISGPYMVLFLVDQARLGPLSLSAVLTARALGANRLRHGVWSVGRQEDERRAVAPGSRRVLPRLRSARLHDRFRSPAPHRRDSDCDRRDGLFPIDCTRQNGTSTDASLRTANRAIGVLRASWSLAWAIGPAIGAAVVEAFGFRGVFFTSDVSGVHRARDA